MVHNLVMVNGGCHVFSEWELGSITLVIKRCKGQYPEKKSVSTFVVLMIHAWCWWFPVHVRYEPINDELSLDPKCWEIRKGRPHINCAVNHPHPLIVDGSLSREGSIGKIDVQSPRMRQYRLDNPLKKLGAFIISCRFSEYSSPPTFIKDLGLFVQQLNLITGPSALRADAVIAWRR